MDSNSTDGARELITIFRDRHDNTFDGCRNHKRHRGFSSLLGLGAAVTFRTNHAISRAEGFTGNAGKFSVCNVIQARSFAPENTFIAGCPEKTCHCLRKCVKATSLNKPSGVVITLIFCRLLRAVDTASARSYQIAPSRSSYGE